MAKVLIAFLLMNGLAALQYVAFALLHYKSQTQQIDTLQEKVLALEKTIFFLQQQVDEMEERFITKENASSQLHSDLNSKLEEFINQNYEIT